MKKVLVVGAGGHAQVVADILLQMSVTHNIELVGFVDDDITKHGRCYLNVPVLGTIADRHEIGYDLVIIGIGDNRQRFALYEEFLSVGESFISAIHPRAIIGSDVSIGAGCVVAANVVVNTGSTIEDNVILNTACTIDHHNHILSHTHVAPGAHLGGDVSVGPGALIGIGATIMPQCHVGEWSVVGAGTVVIRNVSQETTVVGAPGKVLRSSDDA